MTVLMLGGSISLESDSTNTKKAMTMRNMPLTNPERISTRPYLKNTFYTKYQHHASINLRRFYKAYKSNHSDTKQVAPIRVYPCRFPSGHEGSEESEYQSWAVKQHVEAIRDQTKAVGPHSIEQLHKCEGLKKQNKSVTALLLVQNSSVLSTLCVWNVT